MSASTERAAELRQRGLFLEYLTIAWNIGEAAITIVLGLLAGSIALIAFGTDSLIEVFASSVVVWAHRHPEVPPERTERALRLIAVAFVALGVVLAVSAVRQLVLRIVPEESVWGIAYMATAAVVMVVLARAKQTTGLELGSRPLLAEARITLIDAALATSVLLGLLLNAAFGWWWADPVAALIVALVAIHEGRETWESAASGEI